MDEKRMREIFAEFIANLKSDLENGQIIAIHEIEIIALVEKQNEYFEYCLKDKELDEKVRSGEIHCKNCPVRDMCQLGEYTFARRRLSIPEELFKEVS